MFGEEEFSYSHWNRGVLSSFAPCISVTTSSCCLTQWPHFERVTLEWISYWEFPDMLQNWGMPLVGWSQLQTPYVEYDSRYEPRSPYTALPKWLRDSCSYTSMSSYERRGVTVEFFKNLCTSLGGWQYAFDYHNCKIVDEAYLFHSSTVYYRSSSLKWHPWVSNWDPYVFIS